MHAIIDNQAYSDWVRDYDQLSDDDASVIRCRARSEARRQLMSIVVSPPPTPGADHASSCIAGLSGQLDPSFHLLASPTMLDVLQSNGTAFTNVNANAVENANAALRQVDTPFVLFLPLDTRMAPQAVFELATAIRNCPDVDVIYADEDQIDRAGHRHSPRFKTAWDSDLMLAYNAIGNLAAFRVEAIAAAGGLRPAATLDLALYDLLLRIGATVMPSQIRHIPSILFHRALSFGNEAVPGGIAYREVVQRHLREAGPAAPPWPPRP